MGRAEVEEGSERAQREEEGGRRSVKGNGGNGLLGDLVLLTRAMSVPAVNVRAIATLGLAVTAQLWR